MKSYQEYLDINKKKGLPRSYWFNRFFRWFTIVFACFAIIYAVWFALNKVNYESTTFIKVVPFLIIFFALNSLLRNLLTLNQIYFNRDTIELKFLLKKDIVIKWQNIKSIKLKSARQKLLQIKYIDETGNIRSYDLTFAFPNMLEILNSILELAPQIELDEFMDSVVVADRSSQNTAEKE